MIPRLPPLVLLALLAGPLTAAGAEVRDVTSRPGVTQRFLLIKPGHPVATVILFAGGSGGLDISSEGGFGWGAGNFLVRSRDRFAREGLMVAVIDAPSDRLPQPGLNGFRQTPEHARDVAAVIVALRKEANVPVWLVGTSRGTTSVANAAIRLQENGPDGIVLTSSIVGNDSGSLPGMNLGAIRMPVLVVHNEDDQCRITRMRDVPRLMSGLMAAPKTELVTFKGGGPVRGLPCEAFHYHGFVGIEDEVVQRIAGWIKAVPRR